MCVSFAENEEVSIDSSAKKDLPRLWNLLDLLPIIVLSILLIQKIIRVNLKISN